MVSFNDARSVEAARRRGTGNMVINAWPASVRWPSSPCWRNSAPTLPLSSARDPISKQAASMCSDSAADPSTRKHQGSRDRNRIKDALKTAAKDAGGRLHPDGGGRGAG